jgi:hypothetical protein
VLRLGVPVPVNLLDDLEGDWAGDLLPDDLDHALLPWSPKSASPAFSISSAR